MDNVIAKKLFQPSVSIPRQSLAPHPENGEVIFVKMD
jgi:hypothetical protein